MCRLAKWVLIVVCSSSPAFAQSGKLDGSWAVKVITRHGTCPSSAMRVEITDGKVADLKLRVEISGKTTEIEDGFTRAAGGVNDRGVVEVQLIRGAEVTSVRGELLRRFGSGRWEGPTCSGNWSAQKL